MAEGFTSNNNVNANIFAQDSSGNIIPLKLIADGSYGVLTLGTDNLKMAVGTIGTLPASTATFKDLATDIDGTAIPDQITMMAIIASLSTAVNLGLDIFDKSTKGYADKVFTYDAGASIATRSFNAYYGEIPFINRDGANKIHFRVTNPAGAPTINATIKVLFK